MSRSILTNDRRGLPTPPRSATEGLRHPLLSARPRPPQGHVEVRDRLYPGGLRLAFVLNFQGHERSECQTFGSEAGFAPLDSSDLGSLSRREKAL